MERGREVRACAALLVPDGSSGGGIGDVQLEPLVRVERVRVAVTADVAVAERLQEERHSAAVQVQIRDGGGGVGTKLSQL